MSSIKLTHLHNPSKDDLGENDFEFLSRLGGPSVIHLNGKDNTRCRFVVTLLHGNEPSGLKAIHALIKQSFLPLTSLKIIIASVVAARTEPVFSNRMLPGQRDLNRCFSDSVFDLQGQLAKAIAEQINEFSPEAVIDLHNTSGSGPAFCVTIQDKPEHVALASHFTRRVIHTDIRLGSIMEQDFSCPIVTVEAGGAQDPDADNNAFLGLKSFLTAENVFERKQDMEILRQPRRLEIQADTTICFADTSDPTKNITIFQDVEALNFGVTEASHVLGWVNDKGLENFHLDDRNQHVSSFFRIERGQLLTNCPLKLFMVTTRADIAKSDCLFYFIKAESQQNETALPLSM
jgi:hypothetical protein